MTRIFVIEGREFPDVDPKKNVDEIRQYYAHFYPELSNAETKDLGERKKEGSEEKEHLWEFKKRVGTKGDNEGQLSPRIIPPCHLGTCEVHRHKAGGKGGFYAGGDWRVKDKLRNGICPSCDNPTDQKYIVP